MHRIYFLPDSGGYTRISDFTGYRIVPDNARWGLPSEFNVIDLVIKGAVD